MRQHQRGGDCMSGNRPRTASSRFNSLIATATASDEFALSIRRRRTRTAGSLSLIAHLRTNTWASKKELIRTGPTELGKLASKIPAGRGLLMSCAFDLLVASNVNPHAQGQQISRDLADWLLVHNSPYGQPHQGKPYDQCYSCNAGN